MTVIKEFLFTTGLYNYFREKYPEIYPIYKPFVWVFKSGNEEKGLEQLERATRETILSRVEAAIYLSYIYLRYEDTPKKAQKLLTSLKVQYPANFYLLAKYFESIRMYPHYQKIKTEDCQKLMTTDRFYYQVVGHVFEGLRLEKVVKNNTKAFEHYSAAVDKVELLHGNGGIYLSLAYLGMARIVKDKNPNSSKVFLENCLRYAETKDVKQEARQLLKSF